MGNGCVYLLCGKDTSDNAAPDAPDTVTSEGVQRVIIAQLVLVI